MLRDYKKARKLVKALNSKSMLGGGGGFYVTCRTKSNHIVLILKALKAKAKMIQYHSKGLCNIYYYYFFFNFRRVIHAKMRKTKRINCGK